MHRDSRQLLHKGFKHIKLIEWPPDSPDINPRENLWFAILLMINHQFSTGLIPGEGEGYSINLVIFKLFSGICI